jgi:hypothetical protein
MSSQAQQIKLMNQQLSSQLIKNKENNTRDKLSIGIDKQMQSIDPNLIMNEKPIYRNVKAIQPNSGGIIDERHPSYGHKSH